MLFLSTTILAWLAWARADLDVPFDYYASNNVFLDEDGKFNFFWRVRLCPDCPLSIQAHLEIDGAELKMEVLVESGSWLGLGFSPNGGMKGSDIVFTGVTQSGTPFVIDTHGVGNEMPVRDESQDYQLRRAASNGTHTRVALARNLTLCHHHDWSIGNDTLRMIWAYGVDPVSDSDVESLSFAKHQLLHRGAKSIILSGTTYQPPPLPDDAFSMDFFHKAVDIPSDYHTHYQCQVFQLPKKQKHHVIKIEVVFTPSTRAYVHHILLYHCMGNMSDHAGKSEACFDRSQTKFSPMYACATRLVAGWAVGGTDMIIPEDLGFPLFENGTSPYLMLEVHYDNSHLHQGKVDNSGLRLWLTPEIRKYDVGSLSLGMGVAPKAMLIPPRQNRFVLYSFCDRMCTSSFPDDGIKIISVFPHAHYLGVGMILRHIRDGVELEPIVVDHSYDFDYQDSRKFWPPVVVRQNDTLLLECHFDSSKRENTTFGGYSTKDEMCFAFIAYYPRFPDSMTLCISGPLEDVYARGMHARTEPGQGAFSQRSGNRVYGKYGDNVTLMEYAQKYDWSDDSIPILKTSESLRRSRRRTTWKGEIFQRQIRAEKYFETCGRMAPDGATGVDLKLAEFEGAIEQMQWTIQGNKSLPLPKRPYRKVDKCGRTANNSEDWELDDIIPKEIMESIEESEFVVKKSFARSGANSTHSLIPTLVTVSILVSVVFLAFLDTLMTAS